MVVVCEHPLLYEYNTLISFSSSKAKINLHVKNQRRQDYLFECEDSNKGINAPPPQMTTATISGDTYTKEILESFLFCMYFGSFTLPL